MFGPFMMTLGAALAAGCSTEQVPAASQEMVAGKISGEWPHGSAMLRVAYGKRWVAGGEIAANSRGEFQVPSSAGTVVPYLDANHNGKFDRFAEPSGDCHLTKHEWVCSILLRRTTLHRATIIRNDRENDKTYVFWEDFRTDGTRIDDSRLCLTQRCTNLERGPFLSRSGAPVQELSICGEEGFVPQDASLHTPGHNATVRIMQPEKLDVSMRTEPSEPASRELRLHIKTPPIDRVIIWGGSVNHTSGDIKNVYWSSEDANIPIIEDRQGMEARIPFSKIQLCQRDPECEIVVQLLKYWSSPSAPLVSATEYRSTVDVRSRPPGP
ncbi:MAG TPA: hypothetical protein VHN14_34450 [Kofleriaceae bacterium]|jgi:hypothetical protein|nr:hypothetical protein [Kofleriaceae bacterium]